MLDLSFSSKTHSETQFLLWKHSKVDFNEKRGIFITVTLSCIENIQNTIYKRGNIVFSTITEKLDCKHEIFILSLIPWKTGCNFITETHLLHWKHPTTGWNEREHSFLIFYIRIAPSITSSFWAQFHEKL